MKRPIFLESTDKVALKVLTDCVTHLLCCFNYSVNELDTDYEPPYMTDIVITPSGLSCTIVGKNQLAKDTVEKYEKRVAVTQSIWEDPQGSVKIRVNFPDTIYSFGSVKVYLSPCVVLFLNNNVSANDTNITIKTKSPLVTSLDVSHNKLSITADSSAVYNTLAEPRASSSGIFAINGIRPTGGNIQITGIGGTTVTVASDVSSGDSV